jgi:aspartyl/asparaginyl beta-hydroxylase (cupin superfamily)
MSVNPVQQQPLYQSAIKALQHGQFESAKRHLLTLLDNIGPEISVLLALALTYSRLNDMSKCFEALDQALVLEPNNVTVLVMKGDLYWGQGNKRLANHCYSMAIGIAKNTPDLPQDLKTAIDRVSKVAKEISTEIEQHLHKQLNLDGHSETHVKRFRQSMELLNGSKRIFPQKPRAYYFPELPLKQFYEREQFTWAADVEAATDVICSELNDLMKNDSKFEPYIKSSEQGPTARVNPLLDKTDWSAFFLIKDGKVVEENAAKCPRTMEILQSVPLPDIEGRAPMVLFSLLKPNTKIAPHHGFLNTRLICHLPLMVPNDCGLRVGNEVHHWKKGELVVFDDSIEHEAWNNSQHNRIVLIFDIWRPELTELERKWVTKLLEAIDTYDG